jgi:hypothetical protein
VLRSTGPVGEYLINFYKNHLTDTAEAAVYGADLGPVVDGDGPPTASLAAGFQGRTAASGQIGIELDAPFQEALALGHWYRAKHADGVYAGIITPEAAGEKAEPGSGNTVYMAAWDLTDFALNYRLGTTHPRLDWSNRAPLPHSSPGPDGFDDAAPLIRLGMVPPDERLRVAGTFTGGFKREHGAFRGGANAGQHYGFAENGVVFSTLQPDQMTILAGLDGQPRMRVLSQNDASLGTRGLLFARQTGYPLIEDGQDGSHLTDPNGNWSGANDLHPLTLRSGACLLPGAGTNFLVYAVFTASTPKAMATTFRALGCREAALLDMNYPILVYSAVYYRDASGRLRVEHLMRSMGRDNDGGILRFVDAPDSRDFFYLTRRDGN